MCIKYPCIIVVNEQLVGGFYRVALSWNPSDSIQLNLSNNFVDSVVYAKEIAKGLGIPIYERFVRQDYLLISAPEKVEKKRNKKGCRHVSR